MKIWWSCVCTLLVIGLVITCAVELDDDEFSGKVKTKQTNTGSQILLEHSVDNGKTFGNRGKITYLTAFADELDSDETKVTQSKLSEQELTQLKNLIQQEGYYQLRVPISAKTYSVSSVKACALVASNFQDQITVHFGPQGVSIARVDYSTIYGCDASTDEYVKKVDQLIKSSTNANWRTTVKFGHAVEASSPNLHVAPEQQQKEQEQQQPQSWWSKYWYIILPVFLMMLMNAIAGVAPPEGQAQQGQGQRAPAQRAAPARRT
mmetsp:Transcript_12124/g.16754  ORF Transcript_12124/g.16754 Transcript_12124/m.16754 type:complete len:263 (-) Transcript_12124:30-818(-)